MRKRFLTALLAVMLIAALGVISASAADEQMSGACGGEGSNVTWRLVPTGEQVDVDTTGGEEYEPAYALTISGSGRMDNYVVNNNEANAPWAGWRKQITDVVVEDGVTYIGEWSFKSFTNLTTVTLPDSVTEIGRNAFNAAASHFHGAENGVILTNIPSGLKKIGYGAFASSRLKVNEAGTLVLPATVTEIGGQAFSECHLSAVIVLSPNVTIGDSAFKSMRDYLYALDLTMVDSFTLSPSTVISGQTWLTQTGKNAIIYVKDSAAAEHFNLTEYGEAHLKALAVTNGGVFAEGTNFENGKLPEPIKDGFKFGGWYTDSAFSDGSKVTEDSEIAHAVYYARWEESVYEVPDNVDLGAMTAGNLQTGTVNVRLKDGQTDVTSIVSAVSSDEDIFTVSVSDGSITITPNAGLRAGSYCGVLTVTTDDGATFLIDVSFAVEPEPVVPDPNPITVTQPANGTVSTNFSNASAGATITVTATPNSGYVLSYITVNGEKIDGNTFTMPDKAVTVSAVFIPATGGFADVVPGAWYVDAVNYVVSNGLMEGTSATTFEPEARMTRAMFWTILARIDGETITGATWADDARTWAMANGVSDGTNPHAPLTREQLVTMLWRYLGEPATTGTLTAYTDANTVSEWAKTAMAWAIEKGIITGVTTTTLAPQSIATRAQCATILMRNAF